MDMKEMFDEWMDLYKACQKNNDNISITDLFDVNEIIISGESVSLNEGNIYEEPYTITFNAEYYEETM